MVDIFSPESQKTFRENLNRAYPMLEQAVKLLEERGLKVRGSFALGSTDEAISLEVGQINDEKFVSILHLRANNQGRPTRWTAVEHK